MLNILHLSDLHFGKLYVSHVGDSIPQIAASLSPDLVVISGDLTQRAKRREFKAARDFMDRLPAVPCVVVPGNHDVPLYRFWERLLRPYGLYQRYIAAQRDTVLRLEQAVIVGLDSTSPYRTVSNGHLTSRQLHLCAEAFSDLPPDVFRIVVNHHHLTPAPDYARSQILPYAKQALEFFTRCKVDLILAGHQHRAYVGNSLDVYAGEDREHGIIIVQCGTTTSRRGRAREREKNSFNWIRLTSHSIRVAHHMYFEKIDAFAPISQHEFARPSHGYLHEGVTPERLDEDRTDADIG